MQTQNTMQTMRELDAAEIDEISGGNYIVTIGGATIGGAILGGAVYSYDVALSGTTFDWSLFSGAVLQGAVTGFLGGVGSVAFTLPGGFVAGVTAEATAGVVTITNPYESLQ